MSRDEFAELVDSELVELPDVFRAHLQNVLVSPATPEQELERTDLFGLYQGVPEPDNMGRHMGRITLWQTTMEAVSSSREELQAQVRTTLLHEIGHHFGMTEDEVRRATYPQGHPGAGGLASELAPELPSDPASGLLVLLLLVPVAGLYRAWRERVWPGDEILAAAVLAALATSLMVAWSGPVGLLTLFIPGLSIPSGLVAAGYLGWQRRRRARELASGSQSGSSQDGGPD